MSDLAHPVVVADMDDTLLRTDVMFESIAAMLKRPFALALALAQLARGKPAMKAALARGASLDVSQLPVDSGVLDWLRRQREAGASLALYSAADESLVKRVALRFDMFEFAQGSTAGTNLRGDAKCDAIEARYGGAFCYVGDSRRDLPIWARCGQAVLVGDVARLRGALPEGVTVHETFARPRGGVAQWLSALRVHQWVKNALVFVPIVLSGSASAAALVATLLTFVVFGVLASAMYILNDLTDLAADRMHPDKRHRAFASGALPIRAGLLALPLLALAAIALLALLPPRVAIVAGAYVLLTGAYSMRLKEVPILDLMLLAFLFTLRLVAGMVVIEAPISPWLLTFSMFFFFSIAAMKRYDELRSLEALGADSVAGRGYHPTDAAVLMAMGLTSGACSTLVFFIYLVEPTSPARTFAHPQLMWVICIILAYWLGRAWLITGRGAMHVDPVLFALRDRVSLTLGVLTVAISLLAR